jgi:hypothetical protein
MLLEILGSNLGRVIDNPDWEYPFPQSKWITLWNYKIGHDHVFLNTRRYVNNNCSYIQCYIIPTVERPSFCSTKTNPCFLNLGSISVQTVSSTFNLLYPAGSLPVTIKQKAWWSLWEATSVWLLSPSIAQEQLQNRNSSIHRGEQLHAQAVLPRGK